MPSSEGWERVVIGVAPASGNGAFSVAAWHPPRTSATCGMTPWRTRHSLRADGRAPSTRQMTASPYPKVQDVGRADVVGDNGLRSWNLQILSWWNSTKSNAESSLAGCMVGRSGMVSRGTCSRHGLREPLGFLRAAGSTCIRHRVRTPVEPPRLASNAPRYRDRVYQRRCWLRTRLESYGGHHR